MIPEYTDSFYASENRLSSKTYGIDFESGRVVGKIDGLEALKQAVFKILSTERFEYVIYSRNYGTELKGLFGKPKYYVYSELERCIRDALLADDRINAVYGFSFREDKGNVLAEFTVDSVFGSEGLESVVILNF